MHNFYLNDLMDETLRRYYQTFAITLDTSDYVPEKYNEKIRSKYIYKNLKLSLKNDLRINKAYQRGLKNQERKNKHIAIKESNKLAREEKKQSKQLAKIEKRKNKKEKKQ